MKSKIILALILVALLAVLLVQNTEIVTFRFYFWTVSLSQVILVPLVAGVGFLAGFLVGAMVRKGGRRQAPGN
jgi:uncharacterized integral membrane protein